MHNLILLILFLISTPAFAQPFLTSDLNPDAIGGRFEVHEITEAFPEGRFAYDEPNTDKGAIWLDLNGIPVGTHKWKIRYNVNGNTSGYVSCVLTVSILYYKTEVKTFKYYSFTKSWVLKVPE